MRYRPLPQEGAPQRTLETPTLTLEILAHCWGVHWQALKPVGGPVWLCWKVASVRLWASGHGWRVRW